jgi:hypothetical protein
MDDLHQVLIDPWPASGIAARQLLAHISDATWLWFAADPCYDFRP